MSFDSLRGMLVTTSRGRGRVVRVHRVRPTTDGRLRVTATIELDGDGSGHRATFVMVPPIHGRIA